MLLIIVILLSICQISLQNICHSSNTNNTIRVRSCFPNESIQYVINEKKLCTKNGPNIIIAIHSSANNIVNRNNVRNSYGSFKQLHDKSIQIVFFTGMSLNETINKDLQKESDNYRDIIQADFIDSYRNLTLKHVTLLNWVNIYCNNSSYLIKADDDTIIDIFHLNYFLSNYDLTKDFYCKKIHSPVQRYGKWAVSKDIYPFTHYPLYCEGFAYILTNLTKLSEFVQCSMDANFFWIDDVFLLGMVRKALKMSLSHFPMNFANAEWKSISNSQAMDFIFFRNGDNSHDEELWKKIWNNILIKSFDLYM